MRFNFCTIDDYGYSNLEYRKIEPEIHALNKKRIKHFSFLLLFVYLFLIIKNLILLFFSSIPMNKSFLFIIIPFLISLIIHFFSKSNFARKRPVFFEESSLFLIGISATLCFATFTQDFSLIFLIILLWLLPNLRITSFKKVIFFQFITIFFSYIFLIQQKEFNANYISNIDKILLILISLIFVYSHFNHFLDEIQQRDKIKEQEEIFKILFPITEKEFDFISQINLENEQVTVLSNHQDYFNLKKKLVTITLKEYLNLIYQKKDGKNFSVPNIEEFKEVVYSAFKHDDYIEDAYFMADGSRKRLITIKVSNKPFIYSVAWIDITPLAKRDKQKTDEMRFALQKAEEASTAKSTFLNAMNHDLRTPLNAIIGMTNLAFDDIKDNIPLEEKLNAIRSSSEELLHIIDEILQMSRLVSHQCSFNITSENLNQLIFDIKYEMTPFFKKNEQKLIITSNIIHSDVLLDKLKFLKIIENLLDNASKYSPKESVITLDISENKKTVNNIIHYLIQVKDEGCGIPKSEQDTIFNSFYRTGIAAKGGKPGSGLGLSIVKNIVEIFHGTIKIKSKINEGTTFIVDLPIKIPTKEKENKITEVPDSIKIEALKGKKILVIEDHPLNQKILVTILKKYGLITTQAENGKVGLKYFLNSKENEYFGILMDIQMPIMDGYETTGEIRKSKHPDALSIPIIAISANTFEEDIDKCIAKGMNNYLSKPIDRSKLLQILFEYIPK